MHISAICASPPHFNPGMHLVDLALEATLRRFGIGGRLEHRLLYLPDEMKPPRHFDLPLIYTPLRGRMPEVLRADAIVFWGDFLHSRHYRGAVARVLQGNDLTPDLETALRIVDAHFFLSDASDAVLGRCLLFGQCLLTDDGSSPMDEPYRQLSRRLFENAAGVWMRDALSAHRAADLRGRLTESALGIDCALLLDETDYDRLAARGRPGPASGPTMGVFFARTKGAPRLLLTLARDLGERAGACPVWIPWFEENAVDPDLVGAELRGVEARAGGSSLAELIRAVRRCAFVVTDTYHLALTAWNLGVPALCVGRGATHARTSVSDKKKELFYAMYGADRLYVFAEQLGQAPGGPSGAPDWGPLDLDRLVEHLTDRALLRHVRARIAAHRTQVSSDFVRVLTAVPVRSPSMGAREGGPPLTARARGPAVIRSEALHGYGECVAIMAVRNEADIIAYSLKKLVDQGIGVYILDNWSSDGTVDQVRLFEGRGLVGLETYPARPSPYFSLGLLMQRVEELHSSIGARWTIHQDADEIRESPWPGLSYREGLIRVQREGFNCVNHIVANFRPTHGEFPAGADMEKHFTHFEWPRRPSYFQQWKAWHTTSSVDLKSTGGHVVDFEGQCRYPVAFVLKHYPIRDQAHGVRKVIEDRMRRFDPGERANGWHTQYDGLSVESFTWEPQQLEKWTPVTKARLITLTEPS